MSLANRKLRRRFIMALLRGLRVVWPVLSVLLMTMGSLGALIGYLQGWGVFQGVYFAFVTGLTIGYGDFAPTRMDTRLLSIGIGLCGILLTGIVVAVGVLALQSATPLHRAVQRGPGKDDDHDRPAHP